MKFSRHLRALILFSFLLFASSPAAEPPTVAVMPESLLRTTTTGAEKIGRGGALAEQVRLVLGSDERWSFVERADLTSLEREHGRSAAGTLSDADAIRSGRFSRAQWVLTVRLLATDLTRPATVVEVFDTLRAERLAKVEAPLDAIPDESWLLSPKVEIAAKVAEAARRALLMAQARADELKGRLVIAPIGFLNVSRTDRLEPLDAALRNAITALEKNSGLRLHVLPLDTVAETFEESLLAQAGMVDIAPEEWARFADAFVWVEFSEAPASPGSEPTIASARVELTVSARGGASDIVRVQGAINGLPDLATRAAKALAAKIEKTEAGGVTPETRAALAKRLIAAAKAENPRERPWNTPHEKRRFLRAARLVELAAFLSPENREWRELDVRMARQAGADARAHAHWADRYWQIVDQFIVGADGSVDVGLLARADSHLILTPGGGDRFLRIGRTLGENQLPSGANLDSFADRFVHALAQSPALPRRAEVFEAMWPALRQSLKSPRDYDVTIMESIYRDDRTRGRAFLTRMFSTKQTTKIVVSPDPWIEFSGPLAPPRPLATTPADLRPHIRSPRQTTPTFFIPVITFRNNRVVETPHESLDGLARLQTRVLEFEPFRVAKEPIAYDDRITRVVASPEGLWVIASPNHTLGFGAKSRPVFFDFNRHEASTSTAFGELDTATSALTLAGGRLWLATTGQGLRVLNRHSRQLRIIDSSHGLLRDDVLRLEVGRDAAFTDTGPGDGDGEFLSRVPFDKDTAARATPETSKTLDGLPAAVRAAIASFGPDARPRVTIPAAPGRSTWSKPSVAAPGSRPVQPLRDTAFATHCRTAVGDGYWVGDGSSVAWAAGNQLQIIARFAAAKVQALADDGRHLFIAATLQEFSNPRDGLPPLAPDALRIYVYDHQAGAWRGYFRGADHFESMSATPGLLAFTPPETFAGKRALLAMNTAALHPSAEQPRRASADRDLFSLIPVADIASIRAALAAGARVNGATATGWTPLMAALWADRPEVVRLLLDAGVRADAVDHRGWHPLLIASAWSSPACLETVLATGVSPNFQAPSPGASTPGPHFPRLAALHAALRSDRSDSVAILLRAGADPDLANDSGSTPRAVASPVALSALPARSADPAQLNQQLSQLVIPQKEIAYIDAIRPLLAAGADPLWTTAAGKPAILKALDRKFFAAAELMLARIDDLDRASAVPGPGTDSRTLGIELLLSALGSEQTAFAERLLDKGLLATDADHTKGSVQDPKLLRVAIEKGNARITRALLVAGFRFSAVVNDVHDAVVGVIKRKDAKLLAALLEPVRLKNGRHSIPISSTINTHSSLNVLFAAIEAEWEEGIRLLIKAGAERNACNSFGQTLVQVVRAKPALALVFNDRPGAPDNTLEGARAMHAVADRGVSLAESDLTPAVLAYHEDSGETLLMAAARRGDGALVRRLLAAGADPKAATTTGATALSLGILACDEPTVAALLAAGASPDGAPGAKSPPLHVAAFGGNADRVAQLLAAGADPTLRLGHDGMSPLHSAAASPHGLAALRVLMDSGRIDLNATTYLGRGVLEAAVTSDSPEKIQYLLDKGARWQNLSDPNYHPMDVAASRGLTGSLRKLVALGIRSPRALSLAKDDATRAILLSDESKEARIARDNETLWPDILRDAANWRARAGALLADGGDVNHRSEKWGQPLDLAMRRDDIDQAKYLLDLGADPVREQPSFSTSTGKTVFYAWMTQLHSRAFLPHAGTPRSPAELDALAIAFLGFFWDAENHEEAQAQMLRAAFDARLPKTAARMVELGASPRFAIIAFDKPNSLTSEERSRWTEILGLK